MEAKTGIAERRYIGKRKKKKINDTRLCPGVLLECFCIPFEFFSFLSKRHFFFFFFFSESKQGSIL